MKKYAFIIFCAIALTTLISSCTKKTSVPAILANTITVAIDGIQDTFNISTKAEKIGSGTDAFTDIVGTAKNGDQFELKLRNPNILAGQKYVSTAINGSYTYFCNLDVNINNAWFGAGYGGNSTEQVVTVTITSITPTAITATFSGKIADENSWVDEKDLTNGNLNVSF